MDHADSQIDKNIIRMPNISLCSISMNRNFHLEETIPTWINIPEITEIIIVDWSSDIPVKSIVDKYQNGKIIVIRVEGQKYFNSCVSRNIGAKLATSEFMFMVDADIKIDRDIFNTIVLDSSIFYTGGFKENNLDIDNQYASCGTCIITKEMFNLTNGYNENMGEIGLPKEDTEFYTRVEKFGFYRWGCLMDHVLPIPHDNNLRLNNIKIKDYNDWHKNAIEYIKENSHEYLTMKKNIVTIIYPSGVEEIREI